MQENSTIPEAQLLFQWQAEDHHDHKRGKWWLPIFSLCIFGMALFAIVSGDWIMSIGFFTLAAIYFWSHRNENQSYTIEIFNTGFFINKKEFIPKEKLEGYWFVYDQTVSIINLEFKITENLHNKITLQMADHIPDTFRAVFNAMELKELKDKKENVTDIWGRALKL